MRQGRVNTTTDVRTVNRTDDKARVVSYAVFEAVLLTHVSDEEGNDADFGYIETVEITQTIDPVQDAEVKTYLVGPQPSASVAMSGDLGGFAVLYSGDIVGTEGLSGDMR